MTGDELIGRVQAALLEAQRAHEALHDAAFQIGSALQRDINAMTEGEMTDAGYLFRECERLLNDARKEAERRKDGLGKVLVALVTKRALSSGCELIARGELATATPDIKMRAKIPKKDTPEYFALLEAMGVPEDMRKTGVLTFHWRHMSDWITEAASRGVKLPPGIASVVPDATVTYRKKH